jgi:beige protein homolog 1
MANRLKRFWDVPILWAISLSILFGLDVSELDLGKDLDLFGLIDNFAKRKVAYIDFLPVITSMLQHGFKEIMKYQDDPDSPATRLGSNGKGSLATPSADMRQRARSLNLAKAIQARGKCDSYLYSDVS